MSDVNYFTGGGGAAGAEELTELDDATITTTQEWPGPYVVTGGSGAPTTGTGNVGEFYVDATTVTPNIRLYGPKAASGTIWPLIGDTPTAVGSNIVAPVGNIHNAATSGYYVQLNFTPPSTFTLNSVWGPYSAAGVGELSVLSYKQSTRQWTESNGEFATTAFGGNWAAQTNTATTGTFFVAPQLATCFFYTLTGNLTISTTNVRPWITSNSRAARLIYIIKQGGSGGYSVTWPGSISWPGGAAPVISTAVGDADVFELITNDNGTTWTGIHLQSGSSRNKTHSVATKTADYTIARGDIGNVVVLNGADNRTFTIPTNATMPVPIGSRFTIGTMAGGHITLAGAAGVTLTGTTTLNAAGQIAEVIKVAADTWISHH